MTSLLKRIHFTGICGVATSALAIAFHKKGVHVTGSDKGFYPPVSTYLTESGISYYAGWHPEQMVAGGMPDLIVTGGGGTSPSNPELVYARENNIPVISFAEAISTYIIKEKSIVVTGTWGKTTISALLSYILLQASLDPSYFTGGLSLSHDTGALSDSGLSVVEGDEYQVSISDRRPKFALYAPTHLLLTSVSWDHADLYPTEQAYFDEFKNLIAKIPASGLIVYCADNEGTRSLISGTTKKNLSYGTGTDATYQYHSVEHSRNGLVFTVTHNGTASKITSPMLGRFNAENITAAFAMAHSLGIDRDKIISAIASFQGIRRRFEKRFEREVTVLDCHAPTPEKAASVLESIKEVYPQNVIAIYEPNIGGRQHATAHVYDGAFKSANMVIIPYLTKLKVDANASEQPLEGDELATLISKTHSDVKYIDDDAKLIEYVISQTKKDDCIVFLGSHGFRGMIEETIKKLQVASDK